jgi:hypothetical protein
METARPGDDVPADASRDPLAVTDQEVDYLETLAEFEIEHRRILAMQTLYYKRRRAGGVA